MDVFSLEFWTQSPEDVQRLVLSCGAIFAAGLAFWRVRAANKSAKASEAQADVARQAHIAELLKDASAGLGDKNEGVRFGAIHTLARLGYAYEEEKFITLQTFADYMQQNFKRKRPVKQKIFVRAENYKETESLRVLVNAIKKVSPLEKGEILIKDVDFSGANFSGVNLRGIKFQGCLFDRCNFADSEIYYCSFFRCSINSTIFRRSKIYSVNFIDSPISFSDFYKCSFTVVKFSRLYAYKTSFKDTFLKLVAMKKVMLEETNFSKAVCNEGLVFDQCKFGETDISEANLFQSSGLPKEDLTRLIYNNDTVFPWSINLRLRDKPFFKKLYHSLGG